MLREPTTRHIDGSRPEVIYLCIVSSSEIPLHVLSANKLQARTVLYPYGAGEGGTQKPLTSQGGRKGWTLAIDFFMRPGVSVPNINTNEKTDLATGSFIGEDSSKSLHLFSQELLRWRQILEAPYRRYLLSR
jgi:hypothetical protein